MDYGPILDWWVIPHICFYLWVASQIHACLEPKWWVHILLWLILSLAWEVPEHFLQRAYTETWVVIEHPINSWIIDPISNGIGWLFGAMVGAWSKARKKCK